MDPDGPQESKARKERLEFADLVLDPERRIVLRDGVPVSLGKLTFNLLLLLARSAPAVVSQDEVARVLWKGRPVSVETVRQRIKLLRKALDDEPENPRYLRVARGQGYGLIPAVTVRAVGRDDPPPRRFSALKIAAVSVVVVAVSVTVLLFAGRHRDVVAPRLVEPGGVAVLPFENLTEDPDDRAFVDGFHNDLLTLLTKVGNRDVISRTSVLQYRDRTVNLKQIGEALGVAHVLEGSVQRIGNQLRINAQLVDAHNDHHLWAEYYDRELTAENLFLIQSEIANAVAIALHSRLASDESIAAEPIPTDNMRAWNFYQLGNRLAQDPNNMRAHDEAASAYQEAVDEDPEFAHAWAALGREHSAIYLFRDRTEDRRLLARHAVDRATALRPDLPETHLARGYYLYYCELDYDAADNEFVLAAERGMSGNPDIFLARARIYVRAGKVDTAIANLERVVRLDPLNMSHRMDLGTFRMFVRDYAGAAADFRRAAALDPESHEPYQSLATLPLLENGDIAAMRAAMDEAPVRLYAGPLIWLGHMYDRDYDAALKFVDGWSIEAVDAQQGYFPVAFYRATTLRIAGDAEQAAPYYADAERLTQARAQERGREPRVMITLADIYANTGRTGEAMSIIESTLRADLDSATRANALRNAVPVLIEANAFDAAFDRLEQFLSGPGGWSIEGLLPNPRLDPVREHPRFQAIVARFRRRQ